MVTGINIIKNIMAFPKKDSKQSISNVNIANRSTGDQFVSSNSGKTISFGSDDTYDVLLDVVNHSKSFTPGQKAVAEKYRDNEYFRKLVDLTPSTKIGEMLADMEEVDKREKQENIDLVISLKYKLRKYETSTLRDYASLLNNEYIPFESLMREFNDMSRKRFKEFSKGLSVHKVYFLREAIQETGKLDDPDKLNDLEGVYSIKNFWNTINTGSSDPFFDPSEQNEDFDPTKYPPY